MTLVGMKQSKLFGEMRGNDMTVKYTRDELEALREKLESMERVAFNKRAKHGLELTADEARYIEDVANEAAYFIYNYLEGTVSMEGEN